MALFTLMHPNSRFKGKRCQPPMISCAGCTTEPLRQVDVTRSKSRFCGSNCFDRDLRKLALCVDDWLITYIPGLVNPKLKIDPGLKPAIKQSNFACIPQVIHFRDA